MDFFCQKKVVQQKLIGWVALLPPPKRGIGLIENRYNAVLFLTFSLESVLWKTYATKLVLKAFMTIQHKPRLRF